MSDTEPQADPTAAFDQMGAALEGVAGMLGTYRRRLVREGVDAETTHDLVCMVAEFALRKAMGE